jgi:hypothetical protein
VVEAKALVAQQARVVQARAWLTQLVQEVLAQADSPSVEQ